MIVERFQVEVHGQTATVSVNNLTPGLNLVVGPRGSGKSTAHAMLSQAVFGGGVHQRSSQDQVGLLIRDDQAASHPDSSAPGAAQHLRALQPRQLPRLKPWYCLEFGGQIELLCDEDPAGLASPQPCEYCRRHHHGSLDLWSHASEHLCRITEGHLASIRQSTETGRLEILTGAGQFVCFNALTPAGQDMLAISRSLAMAKRNQQIGINLPVLLDEPFGRLNARESHLLVDVLRESAGAAQQIVVFTERSISSDQVNLRDVTVHQMNSLNIGKCSCQCHDTTIDRVAWPAESDDSPIRRTSPSVQNEAANADIHGTVQHLPTVRLADDAEAGVQEAQNLESRAPTAGSELNRSSSQQTVRLAAGQDHEDVLRTSSRTDSSDRFGVGGQTRKRRRRNSRQTRRSQRQGKRGASGRMDERKSERKFEQKSERKTARESVRESGTTTMNREDVERTVGKHRDEKQLRYYLNPGDPVVDAPEIGPKMAERLQAVGIHTITDLLDADPEQVVEQMSHKRTNVGKVRRWQQQSRLMCRVPQLRGHDAQILVACEVTEPEQLADKEPRELLGVVAPFSETKEGIRIIRGGHQPDLDEVSDWIKWAGSSRQLDAA